MDHKISELSNCIFDYLASHPNEMKSFTQIYNDISGNTGHRCSALQDVVNRKKYKDMFITNCYTIDNEWANVHKVFKNDVPYLIFSTKPKVELLSDVGISYPQLSDTRFDNISLESIIDCIIDETKRDDNHVVLDNSMLQFLIKNNRLDKLKRLCNQYDVNLNESINGKTLIETAVEIGNAEIVKELMERDHKKKMIDYEVLLSEVKKTNTKLLDEKSIRLNEINSLNRDLTYAKSSLNTTYFVMMVQFIMSMAVLFIIRTSI